MPGAEVMRNQFECKQTGFLSKEGKGMLGRTKCKFNNMSLIYYDKKQFRLQ
jgi:hypothetical protein